MSNYDMDRIRQEVEEQMREEQRQQLLQQRNQQQTSTEVEPVSIPDNSSNASEEVNNEGFITQLGEGLRYLSEGGVGMDVLNAGASALNAASGGRLEGLDKSIVGYDEYKETEQQVLEDRKDNPLVMTGEALSEGVLAGVAAPFTIAGRITNQDTPWSRAPQVIKDSPIYDSIFQITEVMVPSLIGSGVAGGASGAAVLVGESALETALQDDLGETLTGEILADNIGKVATHLGYDGQELSSNLKDGNNNESKALTAVVGFFENLGINFGINQIIKKFSKAKSASPEAVKAAKISGKSPDKVQAAIDDVVEPAYKADYEPSEVIDVDTIVPTSKPSKGNLVVSQEALSAEMLRDVGILDDGLTAGQRSYFTNLKPLSKDTGIQKVIDEVTKGLKRLPDFPDDLQQAAYRAKTFWDENKNLIDESLDDLAENFADPSNELVRSIDDRWEVMGMMAENVSTKTRLTNYVSTTAAGNIIAAAVGEELGIKIQKNALQALNLDNAGIDFTTAIDNLVELQEAAEQFFVPLRRAKRQWSVAGRTQQRKQIEALKNANVQSKVKRNPTAGDSYDAPARNFTAIRKDDADVGKTLREMWDAAKAGDEDALKTLKDYVNYIAYTNPRNVMTQVDNLSRILHREFMKGNSDAASNLMYGFFLSRVSTQVASASSNIIRLMLEPVGAVMSGETAYGMGQLVGGLSHFQEAFDVARRAFVQNAPVNGGSKIDSAIPSLKERQLLIDQQYEGLKQQLIKEGKEDSFESFALFVSRHLQMAGTNPLVHSGMRFLMSADEMTKSLYASQTATARAFKEAAEKNVSKDSFEFKKIVHKHFNEVYESGVRNGKIRDAEVLQGARNISFQRDIPSGSDANIVDNFFNAMQTSANNSAVFRFFVPFTRVSWNILESSAVIGAGSTPLSRWALSQMPRYKAILNGADEVAKIQLKSQFALGQATAVSAVGLAAMGMMTGYESGQLPQTSFIVPAPGTSKGYIAIDYSKIEPFATLLAITADGVNSFRYGAISRGEYDKVIDELVFSLGMSTTNKTFLSGLTNLSQLLNLKNLNDGTATAIATSIASLAAPAALRMVGQILQPYKVITKDDGSVWNTGAARMNQRALGGVGLPVMHSPLTGKPVSRTATFGDGSYWNAVLGSLINEFGFPGKVQGVDASDPVIKHLNEIGFEYDSYSSLRNVNGVPLSLQEQSNLARDMGDPKIGNLHGVLNSYFRNTYPGKKDTLDKLRGRTPMGSIQEGSRAHRVLLEIKADIRRIYQDVKQQAANNGELSTLPGYRQKVIDTQISSGQSIDQKIDGVEGLIAWSQGFIGIDQVG